MAVPATRILSLSQIIVARSDSQTNANDDTFIFDRTEGCGRYHRYMRLLLVEDEIEIRGFLKRSLTEAGYQVEVAGDAKTCGTAR